MGRTALEMAPQEWQEYNPAGAVRLSKEQKQGVQARRRKALRTARKAAQLLRRVYGAQRVVLFGSLSRKGAFTSWSDIDLAAWGIPASRYYQAVDAVTGLSAEFKVDLVDVDSLRPGILEEIEQVGIDL